MSNDFEVTLALRSVCVVVILNIACSLLNRRVLVVVVVVVVVSVIAVVVVVVVSVIVVDVVVVVVVVAFVVIVVVLVAVFGQCSTLSYSKYPLEGKRELNDISRFVCGCSMSPTHGSNTFFGILREEGISYMGWAGL